MNMCLPRDAHDDYPGYGFAVRRNHSLLLFDKETRFFLLHVIFTEQQ